MKNFLITLITVFALTTLSFCQENSYALYVQNTVLQEQSIVQEYQVYNLLAQNQDFLLTNYDEIRDGFYNIYKRSNQMYFEWQSKTCPNRFTKTHTSLGNMLNSFNQACYHTYLGIDQINPTYIYLANDYLNQCVSYGESLKQAILQEKLNE